MLKSTGFAAHDGTNNHHWPTVAFALPHCSGAGSAANHLIRRFTSLRAVPAVRRRFSSVAMVEEADGLRPPSAVTTFTEDEVALACVGDVYKEGGLLGFWQGIAAALVTVLDPAVTFYVFDFIKLWLYRRKLAQRVALPRQLSTFEAMLGGAVAKAVGVSVVAPSPLLCLTCCSCSRCFEPHSQGRIG